MHQRVFKRVMLVFVAGLFLMSTLLTACGGNDNAGNSTTPSSTASSTGGSSAVADRSPLTLDIYNNAANYQGEQTGWFAKIVKDKFNLTLNILAPQVAGDQLYKTRSAAGHLGDIVIIDNNQMEELIPAGLLADLTDVIKDYPNLQKYVDNHYKLFNSSFKKANPEGKIYGLPAAMADTSPTAYTDEYAYSSPMMPWAYYKGVGAPKIDNLNGLLDVLQQMKEKYPKTPDGKPIQAITLWKDWDTWSMENVRWLCNWYGYEQPEGTGSVLLNANGDIVPFTDDNSMYKKILKFYFDANQRGLVDPDSASQDWNKVAEKLTNNQVLLMWYSWQRGFYNSIERGKSEEGNVVIPISDMRVLQNSDAYYGNGRIFGLGAKAKDPKRTLEFMDWMNSPEGMRYLINGIEGFNYEKTAEGKFKFTEVGKSAFQKNTPVPAEFGGGGYQDGQSKINTTMLADINTDPDTGETYNSNYWSSTKAENMTALTKAWQEKFQAENALDYLKKNNLIDIVPNINTSLGSDSSDIKNKRSQCSDLVKNTSWKMVFAKNENEFNQLWTKLKSDLEGLGWNDVVAVDTAKCKTIVDLRAQAVAGQSK